MFGTTQKHLKLMFIATISVVLFFSFLPLKTYGSTQNDFEEYRKLNDEEKRLSDYKDDEEALRLKLQQLDVINKSRKQYDVSPVKLDILASRVANKMSREAAENGYLGHWNMAGEEPYLRYAFAGGFDHVSENAYGEWSNTDLPGSPSSTAAMMKKGHLKFMSERSPADGHKKNIIDKSHNFVGIGFYLTGKQFRYYEEFIDRYLEFDNVPQEEKKGNRFDITVKTNGQNFLYYLIIYREKWPKPMKPAQISKRSSYNDFTNQEYKYFLPWDLAKNRKGDTYKIPLIFNDEGLYYIQIFCNKKEITKPASFDTKGKTPVSGIVIKVRR